MEGMERPRPSRTGRSVLSIGAVVIALLAGGVRAPAPADYEDEERNEAYRQTRDEWDAFVGTMRDGRERLEEYLERYDEYEQFVYDQENRRDYARIAEFLGVDERVAKQKWDEVREYFNTLRSAGIREKLQGAMGLLERGTNVADEVTNAWEFAEKFDPERGRENPTYGLRLIGDILTEGASKIEKVPLVGPILGRWVRAYGEAAGDYANALDRVSKAIKENTRQGALCGQGGVLVDQQAAFESAASGRFAGQDCATYFLTPAFPRLRCQVFIGGSYYFFFHPPSGKGFFSVTGATEKVYDWHTLLLTPRALDPEWLSSRANSLTAKVESGAREKHGRISRIYEKFDSSWIIAVKRGIFSVAEAYGSLDEETFVANYGLVSGVKSAVDRFVEELDRYVYEEGEVRDGETEKPIEGADVTLAVGSSSGNARTDRSVSWEMLLEGKQNDEADFRVSKEGYEPHVESGGRMPEQVILGWPTTLRRERVGYSISGKVMNRATTPAGPVSGADVMAALPADPAADRPESSASTTSGAAAVHDVVLHPPAGARGPGASRPGARGGRRSCHGVAAAATQVRGPRPGGRGRPGPGRA